MAKHYAWSELRNGGEAKEVKAPNGVMRNVITDRNITAFGSEVSAKSLNISEEEFDRLVEIGSVRDYPPPKESNSNESVVNTLLRLAKDEQEEDPVRALAVQVGGSYFGPGTEEILIKGVEPAEGTTDKTPSKGDQG